MKRTLALLLVLVFSLALFLGGCANDSTTDTPSEPSEDPKQTVTPATPDEDPDSPIKLPIVDTTATFQIWAHNQAATYGVMDFNDLEAWQELERRTTSTSTGYFPPPQT